MPDDLEGIEACFSPGVYEVTNFEYDCFDRGMKLFLADKSISEPTINMPQDRYEFIPKYIGITNSSDFMTLDTWIDSSLLSKDSDLLLQMDIEGWEYLVIANASNNLLKRFRILVIEFHNLDQLWIPAFFKLANETFGKILETHSCVHIHPNNDTSVYDFNGVEIPPLLELTFYRNDRMTSKIFENKFPNKLDYNNVERNPDLPLPAIWYHSNIDV